MDLSCLNVFFKKGFSYISGNKSSYMSGGNFPNPDNISYISKNRTFLLHV